MDKASNSNTAQDRGPIVDARDLWCPEPVVRARLALDGAEPGTLLEVWVTDPLAPLDLEALCARTGHLYRGRRELADGTLAVCIQKQSVSD